MDGKSASLPVYVLDSFAVLAYLENEPAADRLRAVLNAANRGEARVCLSLINLGEVLYITERELGLMAARQALSAIEQLPLVLLETTRERIFAAAHLKARFAVAYADAFTIAAAREFQGIVLTGDPEFSDVEKIVKVEWLPKRSI